MRARPEVRQVLLHIVRRLVAEGTEEVLEFLDFFLSGVGSRAIRNTMLPLLEQNSSINYDLAKQW